MCLSKTTLAQCWDPSVLNTETTDWTKSNSSNSWDWTQEIFNDIYISTPSGAVSNLPIVSPYWAPGGGNTFSNLSLFDFQKSNTASEKDFHPKDGWELLVKEFGIPGAANNAISYPFYALYNKYTGKVRAFLLVPTPPANLGANGALLKVQFTQALNNRRTALFQHMKPIAQEVANFEYLDADFPNVYSNENYYWLFSEFMVAYDPCTCYDYIDDLKESTMNFTYFLIQEAEIEAKIEGTLTEQVATNSAPVASDPSFALNGFEDFDKVIKAGQKGYKEWGKYESVVNKYLKQHTDSMYRNKIWKSIDTLKYTDPEYYDYILPKIFPNIPLVDIEHDNFLNGNININPKALIVFGEEAGLLNANYGKIKGVASIIPYVGTAIGLFELFTSGGEASSSTPKAPTVFEANLTLEGRITSTNQTTLKGFYTPGASGNHPNTNFIPKYDNILGTYNILEIPDFEYFDILPSITNKSKDAFDSGGYYATGNPCKINYSTFNEDSAFNVRFKQFKPKSDLKYVVNPASGLEVISMEAAIVLEYTGDQKLFLEKPSEYANAIAMPFHTQINKPQDDVDSMYEWGYSSNAGGGVQVGGVWYNINGQEISTLEKQYENGSATVKRKNDIEANTNLVLENATKDYPLTPESSIKFRTAFLPVTCFDQLNFTVLGSNNYGKIYMKVYTRLKRKDDPDAEIVTSILSFDLSEKIQNATPAPGIGTYETEISAKDYWRKERCCFKCGKDATFWSIELKNYSYSKPFEIVSTPVNNIWFTTRDKTYAGESNLTILGKLDIPDNSTIPSNSLIRAAGEITIGSNVMIGNGSQIYSENSIIVNKENQYFPEVKLGLATVNSISNNCTNYNYAANHLSNDSIINFCKSDNYRVKAVDYNKKSPIDSSIVVKDDLLPIPFSFNLYPNPTDNLVNVEVELVDGATYTIEILDLSGRVIYNRNLNSAEFNNSTAAINTSSFESGLYFVNVIEGTNRLTKRLVITK